MARLKPEPDLLTRAQFDALVDDTVQLQLAKEKAELKRDKRLLEIREETDPQIENLSSTIKSNLLRAEKFANVHRDEIFPSKAKSTSTALALFGFRIGNPTLVLLNRKWTWESVIAAIRAKELAGYLITKTAVDKDAVKLQLDDATRAEIGTRVEQVEQFFIDPKRDEADARRMTTEAK